VTLSGFADEISPDPAGQLAVLAAESIRYLALRSAWSVTVADFSFYPPPGQPPSGTGTRSPTSSGR
jgi:hypothetical protein